jgi:hypothetical protein
VTSQRRFDHDKAPPTLSSVVRADGPIIAVGMDLRRIEQSITLCCIGLSRLEPAGYAAGDYHSIAL